MSVNGGSLVGDGPDESEVEVHEHLLFGWLESNETVGERPQDTSDAIVVRTDGPGPRITGHYRIGALDVATAVGGAVDVEPLPTARRWRGVVLGYLVEGDLTVTQGDQTLELAPGDFVFYTGAQRYRITSSRQHRYLVVRIPTASLALRHSMFADVIATDLSDVPSACVLRSMLASLAALESPPSIAASAHLGDAVVAAAHAVIADARTPGSAKVMSLFNALVITIERNLTDPELNAESIAAENYLSARYVRQIFAANGTTVSALIRQRRLEHIRDELVDPRFIKVPVGSIAQRWAMPDPATFSRAFSQQFGVSPRRYRTLHLLQGQAVSGDWVPAEAMPISLGGAP